MSAPAQLTSVTQSNSICTSLRSNVDQTPDAVRDQLVCTTSKFTERAEQSVAVSKIPCLYGVNCTASLRTATSSEAAHHFPVSPSHSPLMRSPVTQPLLRICSATSQSRASKAASALLCTCMAQHFMLAYMFAKATHVPKCQPALNHMNPEIYSTEQEALQCLDMHLRS